MREKALLHNITKDMQGNLILSFMVEESRSLIEELENMKEKELTLEVKKYRKPRSLDANAYFWQLTTKIADTVNSDKDSIYILLLKRYGVFTDLLVREEAIEMLQRNFRYVEKFEEGYKNEKDMVTVRCYYGSSGYDSLEMSHLINGTINEAHDVGVETLNPDEITHLIEAWKKYN